MKLRCKDGGLALVVHDEASCRDNIGKVVRLSGPAQRNARWDKVCWLIEPIHPQPWHCVDARGRHYLRYVTFDSGLEHPDEWLFPIDPRTWCLDEETTQATPASVQESAE